MFKTGLIVVLCIYSIRATIEYSELDNNNNALKSRLKETKQELYDYQEYYKSAETILEQTTPMETPDYKDYLDKLTTIQQYEENDI